MNLNQVYGRSLLEQSLLELKQLAPFIKDAKIQSRPGEDGWFITRIEVHLKRHRYLMAIKRDRSLRRSILKARDAVLKQLMKVRQKGRRQNTPLKEAFRAVI